MMPHNPKTIKTKTYTKQKSNFTASKVYGVTLVELMIAITIGSIVAIGISSVYTSSKRSFKLQEEFSHLQENGRFAMNYIARFVRSAGYSGCSSALDSMVNNLDSNDEEFLFRTGVEGYEADKTAPSDNLVTLEEYPSIASSSAADYVSISSSISATLFAKLDPLPHTDIIAARVAESSGIEIIDDTDSANFHVNYTGGLGNGACSTGDDRLSGICPGDTVLISDCKKSLLFLVTKADPAATPTSPTEVLIVHSGNASATGIKNVKSSFTTAAAGPEYEFETGSEIVKMTTKFFYIGEGKTGPALFVKSGEETVGTELVEGIENLQVLYGEDTDADNIPNRYVPATNVVNYANVTAVRLSVLLRSVKNLPWRTATSKPYLLGGSTAGSATTINSPSDKRLRRTMSMVIKLRNRAFSL